MYGQLGARDLMKIASNQLLFLENDNKQNKDPTSNSVRKVGMFCLPFLEIIREVMIHGHWCAGSLHS